MTGREYCETSMSSGAYFELFRDSFGPMIAIRASLPRERIAEPVNFIHPV